MKGQISLAVKGRGLLHEPFSRPDLLRVLERERVRETPTGPDPSPSGWPLCKRALNRPCERLFNWAIWRWQSAPHLWFDLYPVTISRWGTTCIWIPIDERSKNIYFRNCCKFVNKCSPSLLYCFWGIVFQRIGQYSNLFAFCSVYDSGSQRVAHELSPSLQNNSI